MTSKLRSRPNKITKFDENKISLKKRTSSRSINKIKDDQNMYISLYISSVVCCFKDYST